VRSKADTSQLNLPHGTNNQKVENRKKLQGKNRTCSEVSVNSPVNPCSPEEEKEGYGEKDLQQREV